MPPPTVKCTHHFHRLSAQETDELVEIVADLIVSCLKDQGDSARAGGRGPGRNRTRDGGQPSGRPVGKSPSPSPHQDLATASDLSGSVRSDRGTTRAAVRQAIDRT